MINKIIIFVTTTLITMCASAETMTAEDEKEYDDQQNNRRLESLKNIPEMLNNYGETIGCNFYMNPNNIVEYPDKHKLIAQFSIDTGCSGGSAMSRPVFVELELSTNMHYYLNMERSTPQQTSGAIPQTIAEIYTKGGKVFYTSLEHDWSKDGRCCPSIKATAELKFENDAWIGIPVN